MMWLELNLAVQSWVSSVKSSGLSTQPCGAPVLSVVVLEVLWPTRTDWGLPVKKSRIQLQRELLRPSRLNLLMSCCGIIVLNAELKSMNSILTYESLFSRWVRARWRVEEIASSVERFGRYANWSGSSVLGMLTWKQLEFGLFLNYCMSSKDLNIVKEPLSQYLHDAFGISDPHGKKQWVNDDWIFCLTINV